MAYLMTHRHSQLHLQAHRKVLVDVLKWFPTGIALLVVFMNEWRVFVLWEASKIDSIHVSLKSRANPCNAFALTLSAVSLN